MRPFVKGQKNDEADAEAICEAAQRPTMRFVPVKSAARPSRRVWVIVPQGRQHASEAGWDGANQASDDYVPTWNTTIRLWNVGPAAAEADAA